MEIYAGLDVHSEFTYGTIMDEKGNHMWEAKVPTTEEGFRSLFLKFQGKHKIKAVFEASRNWNYIASLLRQQSVDFVMAHHLRVRAIASARIKTDKIDSKILAHLLRTDLIPQSYMPNEEIVQLRGLVRYRVRTGRLAAQIKNSIRAILAREGKKCGWTDPTGTRAEIWLKHLQLTPQNRRELNHSLSLLANLKQEISELDKQIKAEALKRPDVALICSIPGFAEYSSLLILSEIGDLGRFETPEQLAAFSGLISSTYQSSSTFSQGRITKQGSKWLRWILVECATIAVRKENRLQRFYLRLKRKKGHQKAIVATARKALMIIWTLLQKQQVFQP